MPPIAEQVEKPDHEKRREESSALYQQVIENEARREILLVEDYEQTGRVMVRLLNRSGYRVTWAQSVAQARELTGKQNFDLLISDLGLPDGSGHELMSELRARHGLRGVALSGSVMERDITRSFEAGFVEHLAKPVSIEQLESVLRRLLE